MRRGGTTSVVLVGVMAFGSGACRRSRTEQGADASSLSASTSASTADAPCPAASSTASATASASASSADASTAAVLDAGPLLPPKDISRAVARLGDKRQAVRDAAAAEIRAAIAANPAASRDKGEAYWKAKIAAVPDKASYDEYVRLTGARPRGSVGGGGGMTANFRLDDFWVSSAYFESESKKMMKLGQLVRSPIHVHVDLGPTFTGHSVTYLVDGTKAEELDYEKGSVTYRRVYHANGQLSYEQHYANGKPQGTYLAFHENGQKESECTYADGKEVGRCVSWWPNGKMKNEATSIDGKRNGRETSWREDGTREHVFEYLDGVETGQAAWDECERPIYAHGTLGDGG